MAEVEAERLVQRRIEDLIAIACYG